MKFIKRKRVLRPLAFMSLYFFTGPGMQAQNDYKPDSLIQVLRAGRLTDSQKATLMYDIANSYLNTDEAKAFVYADSALILSKKASDNKVKGLAYSLQGVVYKNKGEFQKAIEKQLLALTYKEAERDTSAIASCYNNIGILYRAMKNHKKAIEYFRSSNALCTRVNLGKGIAQTYNNIGASYSELGNTDSSIVYYKLALSIAEKINNKAAISTACSNIGEYYGNRNNNELALVYFKRSLELDKADENVYGMISTNINIGGIYTQQKKYAAALENYKIAEQLCIENEEKIMLKDLYWSMSQNYALNNNKDKGYDYLIKYKALSETMLSDQQNKSILELETKYQTEKKDLELEKKKDELKIKEEEAFIKNLIIVAIVGLVILLAVSAYFFYRKKQVQQKAELDAELSRQKELRSRSVIEAEEKERIRIATDLHDGVGQLLSAAKLNLSSLEHQIKIETAEQETAFKNALSLVDDSVKEVRAGSHNMMPNTLLKLGLASAVKEFITKMQGIPDLKVKLEIVGLDDRMPQEKETTLYRVIQEIVSNIVKHAKATELTLQLIRHDQELSVLIEDNGIGFDTANINNFEGIGLKNIISRVEFINGRVHFDSTINRGTTVVIDVAI